jgi:hypothetical protein
MKNAAVTMPSDGLRNEPGPCQSSFEKRASIGIVKTTFPRASIQNLVGLPVESILMTLAFVK